MIVSQFEIPHAVPIAVRPSSRGVRALRALDWLRPRLRQGRAALQRLNALASIWEESDPSGEYPGLLADLRATCRGNPAWDDAAVDIAHALCGLRSDDVRSECSASGPTASLLETIREDVHDLTSGRHARFLERSASYLEEESYAFGKDADELQRHLARWFVDVERMTTTHKVVSSVQHSFDARRLLLGSAVVGGLQWFDPSGVLLAQLAPAYGWDGRSWRLVGVHRNSRPEVQQQE